MRTQYVAALIALLAGCGGGGSEPALESRQAVQTVEEEQTEVNPPELRGRPFHTDVERMRQGRGEGWKPGYATEDNVVQNEPLDIRGGDRRTALSAGGQASTQNLPLGATGQVAPDLPVVPAGANTRGAWSAVYNWPLIPIHVALLPDGRLMSYGTTSTGHQTGRQIYAVWDPQVGLTNGHTVYPKEMLVDIFCSQAVFLPSTNQLLTVGGDNFVNGWATNTGNNGTTLFNPSTNTMVAGNNMQRPRWYATVTTLLDGRVFVMGGLGGEDRPELRNANGTYTLLTNANTSRLDYWYPRNFLTPDGRIFGYDSYGNYYYVNTTNWTLNIVNQWDVTHFGEAGTVAQFRPGRILQIGSYSNTASIIDIRGAAPVKTLTNAPSTLRQTSTATILPNGNVVLTGGSEVYNELVGVNNTAEIWDPNTGRWTVGASGQIARLYHSIGMLMTDGTVLVGGGGAWGPLNNRNVEFYYPPYLFNADGTFATRPVISSAPTALRVGQAFDLTVSDAAARTARVTMIKMGVSTHSHNLEQNFNELSFTRSGNTLRVSLPTTTWSYPPGYYMVFAVTESGTPSYARIIRIDPPGSTPPPPVVPVAPTALTSSVSGTSVTLNWVQSTSSGITQNVILRSSSPTGPFTTLATVSARTTFTNQNVTPGTWYYQVRAVSSSGTSPSSVTTVATVSPPVVVTAPPAPTFLTGYSCDATCWTTDTGIKLNWSQSTGTNIALNTVQRSTSAGGPFTTIATLTRGTTFTDKQVTNGVTYFYRVTATTLDGVASPPSNIAEIRATITLNTPPPAGPVLNGFSISSQGETHLLVMNWWRGDPRVEGSFRVPGSCTGPTPGNCVLGARKTFRPQGFYLQDGLLWLEVPEYIDGINIFDHYPLPVEMVRSGCTFSLRHTRTQNQFEFNLNPPGLEILPHTFTMTPDLCASYDPTSPAWIASLNQVMDQYLGADPDPYTPEPYPYNSPLTRRDPSQP